MRSNKKEIRFFIHNGDNELDTQLQTGVDEMVTALIKQGSKRSQIIFTLNQKTLSTVKGIGRKIFHVL